MAATLKKVGAASTSHYRIMLARNELDGWMDGLMKEVEREEREEMILLEKTGKGGRNYGKIDTFGSMPVVKCMYSLVVRTRVWKITCSAGLPNMAELGCM